MTNTELKHLIYETIRRKLFEMSSRSPRTFEDFRIEVSDILRSAGLPRQIVEEVGFSGRANLMSSDLTWKAWSNIQTELSTVPDNLYESAYADVFSYYVVSLVSEISEDYNSSREKISEMIDIVEVCDRVKQILKS